MSLSQIDASRWADADRRAATVAGIVFIVATAAALASTPFLPKLTTPDYLTNVATGASQMVVGILLLLVAAFSSAAIAVIMYPVMKRWSIGLALVSVIFRAMEGVMYVLAVVFLLSLLTLSHQFATAAGADQPALQAIGDTLRGAHDHAGLAAVFCFCLGAFAYYYLFLRSRLVPLWLSGFGLVAVVMMFAACILALISDGDITTYVPLLLPILVQEMVLAVWLIAKGFNTSALLPVPRAG